MFERYMLNETLENNNSNELLIHIYFEEITELSKQL